MYQIAQPLWSVDFFCMLDISNKMKICKKCNIEKEYNEFSKHRNVCRQCRREESYASRRKKYKARPWTKTFDTAYKRCNAKTHNYFIRGIKFLLSEQDLKFLWQRDSADKLKKPSIDRINPRGNYELDNCRMIELTANIKRKKADRWQTEFF